MSKVRELENKEEFVLIKARLEKLVSGLNLLDEILELEIHAERVRDIGKTRIAEANTALGILEKQSHKLWKASLR